MPLEPRYVRPSQHDWPEDFDKENGQYQCKCVVCSVTFTGYKRRVLCKLCDAKLMQRAFTEADPRQR